MSASGVFAESVFAELVRRAKLLRRHIADAARIARHARDSPPPVARIYGTAIVGDLGDRVLAMISVRSEAQRIAFDVEELRRLMDRRSAHRSPTTTPGSSADPAGYYRSSVGAGLRDATGVM